jgi:ribosome-associated protein
MLLSTTSPFDAARRAAQFLDSKLAKHIVVLDTRDISSLADYFIIASADSITQVQALTAGLKDAMGDQPCLGIETDAQHRWHLLDFGDVIVHVMHRDAREYYQLDTFWNHAVPVSTDQWELRQVG